MQFREAKIKVFLKIFFEQIDPKNGVAKWRNFFLKTLILAFGVIAYTTPRSTHIISIALFFHFLAHHVMAYEYLRVHEGKIKICYVHEGHKIILNMCWKLIRRIIFFKVFVVEAKTNRHLGHLIFLNLRPRRRTLQCYRKT